MPNPHTFTSAPIFVAEKNPNLNDASFSIQKGVANYPNTMWFVAAMPEVWGVIDAIHQDGLFRYLDSCADKDIYPVCSRLDIY